MKNLATKIIKYSRSTLLLSKEFGIKYGLYFAIGKIFKSQEYKTRKMAIKILDKELSKLITLEDIKPKSPTTPVLPKRIFVFWATGYDSAPQLVKDNFARLKKYYPDYEIYFLDQRIIKDFVTIDKNIMSLFDKGLISIQTFSDILRFNLIYQKGGIWVDSTLAFFDRFDFDFIFKEAGFLTLNQAKSPKPDEHFFYKVYEVTWTSYLMGGEKGNKIAEMCVRFYNYFYSIHKTAIDYLMTDYFLCLCSLYNINNASLKRIPLLKGTAYYLWDHLRDSQINKSEIKVIPQKLTYKDEKMLAIYYASKVKLGSLI